jgi:NAD(P)-dependent dehydrogenase (short-subunit alcohol dehydrogenase family)
VQYGVAKAATDKMGSDMAVELKPHGVAVISLYPGLVRTEAVPSSRVVPWRRCTTILA